MDNQTVLTKVIERAIASGWGVFGTECHQIDVVNITEDILRDENHYHADAPHDGLLIYIRRFGYHDVERVVFNHDFAKALWGVEEKYTTKEGVTVYMPGFPLWQHHLMFLSIAEDRIAYLKDNAGIEQ